MAVRCGGERGLPAGADYIAAALSFSFCLAGTFLPLSVVLAEAVPARAGGLALQEATLSRLLVAGAFCWCLCSLLPDAKTLRTTLSGRTDDILSLSACCAVVACCVAEAVIGLLQVAGLEQSNHALYPLTGTFPNPGPFAGYVAAGIPVALHACLAPDPSFGNGGNSLYMIKLFIERAYGAVVWLALMLMCCVLPVSMSRSACIAAAVSSLFVAWIDCGWKEKLRSQFSLHRKRTVACFLTGAVAVVLLLAGMFILKRDSAIGRVFMWRMSLRAIALRPFTGHGSGSFAAAYGEAQESYFASGAGAPQEMMVAGCPETAFNEYLHLAVERGLPALVLFLVLLYFIVRLGLRQKRTGLCGALVALMVFAFSSYPMQFPAFRVLVAVIVTGCLLPSKRLTFMLLAAASATGGGLLWQPAEKIAAVSLPWSQTRALFQAEAYGLAVEGYEELYPVLRGSPDFMFEYGHTLHKIGQYEASNKVFSEAEGLSCDPMILNIIGKNFKGMGMYEEAERYYLRSTHRVPNRMYPWYLLVLLYDEWIENVGGEQSRESLIERLYKSADHVLTMDVKVQSPAVAEMREEVGDILERYEN